MGAAASVERLLASTVRSSLLMLMTKLLLNQHPLWGKEKACVLWPNLRSHRPSIPLPYPLCQGTQGVILGGEAHLGTAGRLAVSNAKGEILVSNTLKTLFYYSLRKPVPRTLVWCHSQNWTCLENPRDGGAWWAAVSGAAQSWTRLKWLSSSSSSSLRGRYPCYLHFIVD